MVRPTHQEMTATREDAFPHSYLGTEGVGHHVGPPGEAPRLVRRRRTWESKDKNLSVVSVRQEEQADQVWDWLV